MFSNIDYFNIDVFFEHRPSLGPRHRSTVQIRTRAVRRKASSRKESVQWPRQMQRATLKKANRYKLWVLEDPNEERAYRQRFMGLR